MLFVALALSACTHDADFEPEGSPLSETGGKDTKPSGTAFLHLHPIGKSVFLTERRSD